MLSVQDIHFSYGINKILKGVSFSAEEGEIVALIGSSGSGKTTLFRLIAGLISPSQGRIVINNQAASEGTMLTYMRQDDLLLPWRTVKENLLLISELGKNKLCKKTAMRKILPLLKKMGLENTHHLYPKELSGGMRQRVSLARALLQNRPLMLLDEPFASLDVIMREQLYCLLRDIRDQYKKTIVMVTHDFRDAMALADHILVLSKGIIKGSYSFSLSSKNHIVDFEKITSQIRSDLLTSE